MPRVHPPHAAILVALLLAACSTDSTGDTSPSGASVASSGAGGSSSSSGSGEPDASMDAGPDSSVMDPGTEGDGDYTIGPDYVDAPELTVKDGVPRGLVVHFTMDSADSKIFPGVTGPYTRDVWVYVPKQYVDGTEAPFMVVQDGGSYMDKVTAAFDTMIDAKTLPPIVGIFIDPGPGDGMGSERGYEYDTVSEDYTTFIETEVLPIIPGNADIQQGYKNLKFTADPEGRASMGGSSGGACAFTMGWFRPDLYRRILTYSGTFVNQHSDASYPHGAWEYHEHLIARTPEKPLRVFLEVGENDLNYDPDFGDGMHDWVAANKAMAKALAAKTYHYRFLYALGAGHVDGNVVSQTLPETLLWLWRGYPIP